MNEPAPVELYKGDDWTFDLVAADGSRGLTVQVLAGGQGYTAAPLVTFGAPPPGGRQATGTAIVANGVVTDVALTDPGDYVPGSPPAATLSGGGGQGARLRAVVGQPIDLTGCTVGAEFFQQGISAGIDISFGVTVTDAVNGALTLTVPDTLTSVAVAASPLAKSFPTRAHVFLTDGAGRRTTVGVIRIIPIDP